MGKELKRLAGIIDNSDNNSDVLIIKTFDNGMKTFVIYILNELGIDPEIKAAGRGVEVTKKIKDDIEYYFILNHNAGIWCLYTF